MFPESIPQSAARVTHGSPTSPTSGIYCNHHPNNISQNKRIASTYHTVVTVVAPATAIMRNGPSVKPACFQLGERSVCFILPNSQARLGALVSSESKIPSRRDFLARDPQLVLVSFAISLLPCFYAFLGAVLKDTGIIC
jgi:hypothetical protein